MAYGNSNEGSMDEDRETGVKGFQQGEAKVDLES